MADVLVRLKNFETPEAAAKAADTIHEAGSITITTDGGDVNFTVGDVTVDNA